MLGEQSPPLSWDCREVWDVVFVLNPWHAELESSLPLRLRHATEHIESFLEAHVRLVVFLVGEVAMSDLFWVEGGWWIAAPTEICFVVHVHKFNLSLLQATSN